MRAFALSLLLLAAAASGEEITSSNFGELTSGCWLLRFYVRPVLLLSCARLSDLFPLQAPWCSACSSTAAEWTAAQQEKALRFGCRFGEVNVEHNMALSETFGVRSIPSFFVAHAEKGLCRFDSMQTRFSATSLVQFYADCMNGARGWESGFWSYPLSWLWRPLVRAGYVAEDLHHFMQRKGLSKTQEIGVAGVVIFLFLLAWGFLVYAVLGWCCGAMVGAVSNLGKMPDEEDEPEEEPKKLKKE